MLTSESRLKAQEHITKQVEMFLKSQVERILINNFPKMNFDLMSDDELFLFMLNNGLTIECECDDVTYSKIDNFTFSVKQVFKDVKVYQTITRELK